MEQGGLLQMVQDFWAQRKAAEEEALRQKGILEAQQSQLLPQMQAQQEAQRQQQLMHIDEVMRQQQAQPMMQVPQPQQPPQGSVIDKMEGGNPDQLNMSPAVIEALRKAGAL